MNALLTPDARLLHGAKENINLPLTPGAKYADILSLNTSAKLALSGCISDLCSVDGIQRSYLEDTFKTNIRSVAGSYTGFPPPGIKESLARRRNVNIKDAVVDRVAPSLPAASDFLSEVHTLLKDVPQNQDPDIGHEIGRNLVGLYTARILETAAMVRDEDVSLIKREGLRDDLPIQTQHALQILEEMKHFGIEDVRLFYSFADSISHLQTVPELHAVQKTIDKAKMNNEAKTALIAIAEKQLVQIKMSTDEAADKDSLPPSKREVARDFLDDLRETYAYIDSLTPEEQKGILSQLPLKTLELFHRTRTLLNIFTDRIATSSELREMFWQLRLGRKVGDFLKNHPLQYARPADLARYSEHLYDKLLRSEGAGFEIKGTLPIEAAGLHPDQAVTSLVQSLTADHAKDFPAETSKPLLFTVIVNDYTEMKLHIPPGSNPEKIKDIIRKTARTKIHLTPEERAGLTYAGYKPGTERWKDEQYRQVYGHGTGNKIPGDYLICVSTTSPPDRMDPFSLYHVGPHKAAVGLCLGENPQLNVIFNHGTYDGVPAKKAYNSLKTRFTAQADQARDSESSGSHAYITLEHLLNKDEDSLLSYPIPEGVGSAVENYPYQKMIISTPDGESLSLSPTDVRAIVVGLANDIDYMHHLYAGSLPDGYAQIHPTHNNVQPTVIGYESLRRVLKSPAFATHVSKSPSIQTFIKSIFSNPSRSTSPQTVNEWAHDFSSSAARCKKGEGPASTMSAVVGTWEGPLGGVAALMHPGTVTLTDANGLFSSIFDPKGEGETLEFTTAQGDSYSTKQSKINLRAPRASVGVIGYNQEGKNGKAVMTCRKFPSQAQVELRNAVLNWFSPNEQDSSPAQKALEETTELIRAWDKLAHGKSSLTAYRETLDETFALLREILPSSIDSPQKLQIYLNNCLNQAAKDTVNPEKLHLAYESLKTAVFQLQQQNP